MTNQVKRPNHFSNINSRVKGFEHANKMSNWKHRSLRLSYSSNSAMICPPNWNHSAVYVAIKDCNLDSSFRFSVANKRGIVEKLASLTLKSPPWVTDVFESGSEKRQGNNSYLYANSKQSSSSSKGKLMLYIQYNSKSWVQNAILYIWIQRWLNFGKQVLLYASFLFLLMTKFSLETLCNLLKFV